MSEKVPRLWTSHRHTLPLSEGQELPRWGQNRYTSPIRVRSFDRKIATLLLVLIFYILINGHKFKSGGLHPSEVKTESGCQEYDFKCHIDAATARYKSMLARQSNTIDEGVANYIARYGRRPPPGYEDWLEFAFENKAVIVDDFDRIEADLQPFRELGFTREQLFARMASAWDTNRFVAQATHSLGHITVRNGTYEMSGWLQEDFTNTIRRILDSFAHKLPDLTILYNWFDEPRIILPTEGGKGSDKVDWEDLSHTSTWSALRRPCKRLQQAKTHPYIFPYAHDKDICSMHPLQQHQHGLFTAPSNFHPTQTLFPMISSSKASTMGDILGPSASYFTEKYRRWKTEDTLPFLEKSKTVYWRGSSTGMLMLHKHWTEGHRQRFALQMRKIQEGVASAKKLLKSEDTKTDNIWPSWYNDTRLGNSMLTQLAALPDKVSDVGFSAFFHCDSLSCAEATHFLPTLPQEAISKSYDHQIVADLDGEGMSGRFYRLIASQSVPLKQTIWHEWHDDRLIPWVHFIPLSLQMDELLPLLSWLLGTEEGQMYGAFIADEGRSWSQHSLRHIDASIYLYRLLLEYAQILNPSEDGQIV